MKKLTIDLILLSISLEELKKPVLNLKALREFYIYNKDVNSYNKFMYLVKDSIVLNGKEKMWSQFIDSKYIVYCIFEIIEFGIMMIVECVMYVMQLYKYYINLIIINYHIFSKIDNLCEN